MLSKKTVFSTSPVIARVQTSAVMPQRQKPRKAITWMAVMVPAIIVQMAA